jgi:putative alpha-1,2-mannosidase
MFTIEADAVSVVEIQVRSATLDGRPLTTAAIHHADLKAGGSLVFQMGPAPSQWGR